MECVLVPDQNHYSKLDLIRRELANYADNKKCRKLSIRKNWFPNEVNDPESGMVFTEPGAWRFIVQKLREGHEIEEIILKDDPPGGKAYVMIVDIEPQKKLYIKVVFGNGCIWGKSFHYAEK